MKPLFDAWLIQIRVTNVCRLSCAHCTAGIRHFASPSFADLGFIERALKSLEGWRKGVGFTGGEPTLHPDFPELCALFRTYFPKHQCGLWTCGGPAYQKHRELIRRTFGIINYNDHDTSSFHHPMTVASEDVIKDEQLREELIDKCWLQLHWSPIVAQNGAFFCEVAATFDSLFGGPGGYPLEPGWWKKDVKGFADQRARYCGKCSIPIPFTSLPDRLKLDWVSPQNAQRLRDANSPQAAAGRLKTVDAVFTREDIERLAAARSRNAKTYATPLSKHVWMKTPLRAWFWKHAKYRHIPGGQKQFVLDTLRFIAIKFRDALSGDSQP
ncbi:MAG: radical SAM protein [Verrucomicrobiales bacterium]|nr:radical SAM protein [Verrucomicrobiales bacterium]